MKIYLVQKMCKPVLWLNTVITAKMKSCHIYRTFHSQNFLLPGQNQSIN